MEGGLAEFSRDVYEEEEDGGSEEHKKKDTSKVNAMREFLESRWPNAEVRYGSGNGGNCDSLVDVLYVRRGNAIGGVFLYRNW